jgi:acyl-CoA synthetase (AMP-forming)/AMP-acid ligase II
VALRRQAGVAEANVESHMSQAAACWGDRIAVELVGGVPFRMYADRPRRVEHLLAFAGRWGSRPHVVHGDRVLTFDDLRHSVSAKAKDLVRLGVAPGERVGLIGWNSPDYVVNFWAVLAAAGVPVLFNTWWSEREVCDAQELLRPVLVLADQRARARIPPGTALGAWETDPGAGAPAGVADVIGTETSTDENEPAVIIFTSGTSGRPKAVVLSHRALLANLQMLLHMTRKLPQQLNDISADVALHTGPLFHIGGAQGMMRGLTVGNTLVLPAGRFEPGEALTLIEQWKITRWAAVPTMVSRVLDHPDVQRRDLRSLRAVTLGGAPLHVDLQRRIRDGLPGVNARIATGYGLSENGGQATAASDADTIERPGTSGRPLPLTEIRIEPRAGLPDGEILIRAPTQMSGYYGSDDSPIDSEGWLGTGDLGRMDEARYIWITGRCKDLIIRGGENVAPAAVEEALAGAPGVRDAIVFGLAHPDLGEEVAAVVVVEEGYSSAAIEAHARRHVASFAVPTWWRFQTGPLPVNPTGKVDKPSVVADVRAELAGQKAALEAGD